MHFKAKVFNMGKYTCNSNLQATMKFSFHYIEKFMVCANNHENIEMTSSTFSLVRIWRICSMNVTRGVTTKLVTPVYMMRLNTYKFASSSYILYLLCCLEQIGYKKVSQLVLSQIAMY